MADITLFNGTPALGGVKHVVASGTVASIQPGDPVTKTIGAATVEIGVDAIPVVATHYLVGFALTASDETAAAAGKVTVQPISPSQIWLARAKSAAAVDTQSEYDALVGNQVLLDLSSSTWTIDESAAHHADNGCVIEYLDVSKHPGKVAFSVRSAAVYNGR
jgi:hypothetical protein